MIWHKCGSSSSSPILLLTYRQSDEQKDASVRLDIARLNQNHMMKPTIFENLKLYPKNYSQSAY